MPWIATTQFLALSWLKGQDHGKVKRLPAFVPAMNPRRARNALDFEFRVCCFPLAPTRELSDVRGDGKLGPPRLHRARIPLEQRLLVHTLLLFFDSMLRLLFRPESHCFRNDGGPSTEPALPPACPLLGKFQVIPRHTLVRKRSAHDGRNTPLAFFCQQSFMKTNQGQLHINNPLSPLSTILLTKNKTHKERKKPP